MTDFYARTTMLCDAHHAAGQAVILCDRIGEGKTSFVHALGARPGFGGVVTLRLAGKSADAVNGIPVKDTTTVGGKTYTTSFETLPKWALDLVEATENGTVPAYLYVQEINLGFPDAIAAFQDVMLERRLPNGFELPESVRIIGDMNPRTEVAGVFDLSPAATNRVAFRNFRVPDADWHAGLVGGFPGETGVRDEEMYYRTLVSGFLTAAPEAVYESGDQVDRTEGPWASRRSWTAVAKALGTAAHLTGEQPDADTVTEITGDLVGDRFARRFAAWATGSRIPTPAELLADPTVLDKADPAVVTASLASLVNVAVSASRGADGEVHPATVADSPVSQTVAVLNHARAQHTDQAVTALLRLIEQAGQAAHGVALLDPARVTKGFVAPASPVSPEFAEALGHVTTLLSGV